MKLQHYATWRDEVLATSRRIRSVMMKTEVQFFVLKDYDLASFWLHSLAGRLDYPNIGPNATWIQWCSPKFLRRVTLLNTVMARGVVEG
jgi:hypothetical protein